MNKAVQFVILIRVRTLSAQLRLVEFCQRCWVGGIRNTKDIIHSIILVPVLHDSLTVRCKVHHLQTFTLFVVGIDSLRAVTELRIDRMTLLIVTYPVNYNALTSLFIARHALHLSSRIVVISHHFTIRISHRLHTVPAVIGSTIDISPDIRHTRHDCTDSLRHLTLSTVVVGFTATRILNEGKTTGTVILIACLTIGISNTIKEVFRIKHLMHIQAYTDESLCTSLLLFSYIWRTFITYYVVIYVFLSYHQSNT